MKLFEELDAFDAALLIFALGGAAVALIAIAWRVVACGCGPIS